LLLLLLLLLWIVLRGPTSPWSPWSLRGSSCPFYSSWPLIRVWGSSGTYQSLWVDGRDLWQTTHLQQTSYVIDKINSKIVNSKSMIDIHEDFAFLLEQLEKSQLSNFFPNLTKTTSSISSLNWWNSHPILNSVKFQIFNVYSL